MLHYFERHWHDYLWSAIYLGAAIILSLIVRAIVFWALRRVTRKRGKLIGHSLVQHGQGPTRWIFPLLACLIVLPGVPLPHTPMVVLEHIVGIGLIAAFAWLVILLVDVTSDVITGRYRIDVADNLMARRIQTQFQLLHRVVVTLVIVIAVAISLMTFQAIQHLGDSILASAGVASLVVGLAMKGTLSNLVAGVQIAFTQPFRIEDAVVIEGNWGWIEEIGTMYVTVRIWDLTRLVVPLSWFLENSFQNWTRTNAELLGHCYIYVDYTVPVEPLRAELKRICESTKLWMGKVCVLQVSDLFQKEMQLRALMDARNSGDAWDLRCYVREHLIDFIQKNYPGGLPRYRGEVDMRAEDGAGAHGKPELPGRTLPGNGTPEAAPLPGDPLRPVK
ncbi:MAG TPA: mechanosensitive ion channel domain-containing protein [Acidobacteriaceae bacterium]|jgi:small-conductance mechanosensitive channel|nr:mechanosensitive ion channel domain-containing protein [Acidobacteriaceae bacterium]